MLKIAQCIFCLIFLFYGNSYADISPQKNTLPEEKQFSFAEGIYQRKFFKDAIKEYLLFIKIYPKSQSLANAYFRLSDCYVQIKDIENAVLALENFSHKINDPVKKSKALLRSAILYFNNKQYTKALLRLNKIEKQLILPDLKEYAQFEKGRSYLMLNKKQEAFKLFQKLANKNLTKEFPIRAYATYKLAFIFIEEKNTNQAQKYLEKLVEFNSAPVNLKTHSLFQLAEIFYSKKDYQKSIQFYGSALALAEKGQLATSAKLGLARSFIETKEYPKALKTLNSIINTSKETYSNREFLLGYCYFKTAKYRDAERKFTIACNTSQENKMIIKAWFYGLNCIFKQEKYKKVIIESNIFLKRFPENNFLPDIYFLQAKSYLKLKNKINAIKNLKNALNSSIKGWDFAEQCRLQLAELYEESYQFKLAAKTWEKQFKETTGYAKEYALYKSGINYKNSKQTHSALKSFNLFIETFPKSKLLTTIHVEIIQIFTISRNYKDALKKLDSILRSLKEENKKNIYFYLRGKIFYLKKDFQSAIMNFKKALKTPQKLTFHSDLYLTLGLSYWSLKKETEAAKAFSNMLEDELNTPLQLNTENILKIAKLLQKNNFRKSATILYKKLSHNKNIINSLKGKIGLAELSLETENLEEAQKIITECLPNAEKEDFLLVSLLSLFAEVKLKLKEYDQVIQIVEKALKRNIGTEKIICRLRYTMAAAMYSLKRFKISKRYASQVYILYNDDTYVPKALFLNIKILLKKKKINDCMDLIKELKHRFPAYYSQKEITYFFEYNNLIINNLNKKKESNKK